MFEFKRLEIRRPGQAPLNLPCAVQLDTGTVIPFNATFKGVPGVVSELNNGTTQPTNFMQERLEHCFYPATGQPVRVRAIDAPVVQNVVVNVMGLNYSVPKPVADYLATVKQGFTDACVKIAELENPVTETYQINGEAVSKEEWDKFAGKFFTKKNARRNSIKT